MHPRLAEEWQDFLETYPSARHHLNPERVEVEMDIGDQLYSLEHSIITVLIPAGYRAVGPDGFLIPQGALTFKDGTPLPGGDATGVGLPGHWLVSFHLIDQNGQSTWRPTADPAKGDNLIGYFASIESFLARKCE